MGNKTKIFGIIVGIFVIFTIVGIAYESATGLNMLTGEKKTSGAGADKWIQEETTPQSTSSSSIPSQTNEKLCDPSYPTLCILPNSPDIDCSEISYSNFRVLEPDPHGFDRDNDGIGCEK